LWARFTPHYTPKHGSWLNPAEIEASLWSRECHGRDRVDTFEALRARTRAWTARADRARRTIIFRFTTAKARRVFRLQTAKHYVAVEALVREFLEFLSIRSCQTVRVGTQESAGRWAMSGGGSDPIPGTGWIVVR